MILSYSIYAIYVSIPLLSYCDSYGICKYDLHYGNHIINNPLKSYHIFAIYQFPSIKHIGWYVLSIRNYRSWSVNHYPFIIHQPIITHLSITAIYPPLSIYHYHWVIDSWIVDQSIYQSLGRYLDHCYSLLLSLLINQSINHYHSIIISLSMIIHLSLSIYQSLLFNQSTYQSLSIYHYQSINHYPSITINLSIIIHLSLSIYQSLSIYHYKSIYQSTNHYPSIIINLSIIIHLSLAIYQSLLFNESTYQSLIMLYI